MYSNAWAILSSVSAWPVLNWDWPGSKSDSKNCLIRSSILLSSRDDTLEHTHHEPAVGCYCCHMQLTEEQRDAIIAWAERTPQVQAVMLFGSRCKGTARPDSDVDLRPRKAPLPQAALRGAGMRAATARDTRGRRPFPLSDMARIGVSFLSGSTDRAPNTQDWPLTREFCRFD